MKKIAGKLMDYGMDFEYECMYSEGERIVSHEASIEVYNQRGVVTFDHCGEEIYKADTAKTNFEQLAGLLENILIEETT